MEQSDILIHHGVKGMKWGVRKRQAKAKDFAQRSKAARAAGKNRQADRLHSKSRAYVQGTPEYAARIKRNVQAIAAGYLAIQAAPLVLDAAGPRVQNALKQAVSKAEKARLSFVLRNDVRFDPSNRDTANMITSGLDFIKKSRGVYNITTL